MLIGYDSSPCSLSLRNRSIFNYEIPSRLKIGLKSDLKNVLYKNLFFQYLLFFQSQSCLLESTAAVFRQSAGYVFILVDCLLSKGLYWCVVVFTTRGLFVIYFYDSKMSVGGAAFFAVNAACLRVYVKRLNELKSRDKRG